MTKASRCYGRYYKSSYVKQYEQGDRLLRTETCLNDTYHLAIGRELDNLPAIKQHRAATTDRYLTQQAELLDSTVDRGALAALAAPVTTGTRRVPGINLHDDRLIRVLDSLLYTGGLLGDWTTRQLHARILARHRLGENDYSLGQLRYDLGKLRAHGLVAGVGRRRCYIDSPQTVCSSARCSSKSAPVCSVPSSPTRPSLPSPVARTPAPWKPRYAQSTEPSTPSVPPVPPSGFPPRPPEIASSPTTKTAHRNAPVVCIESAVRPDKAASINEVW